MPQPGVTLEQGEILAEKYQVEELLGQGGMGAVYAARHTGTGRRFAIKWLRPELVGDAEAEARFLREAMLASAINHPAIVEVYDIGRHRDAPFMVMKLLAGESLGARLKHTRFTKDAALAVILPVLDGVAAAHARGIVHRDLKPDNIMFHRERNHEQPKVLDFGISKLLGADARTRLTKTGISLGTPLYMSPEQVRGDGEVDLQADVYALGVILYQLLTGELPFMGNNYPDLVLQIVEGNARSVRALNPELPIELERIVKRAMAVARAERYPSVAELAAELRALRANATAVPVAKESPRTSAPEPGRESATRSRAARHGLWLGGIAALALAGLALWALRAGTPTANAIERPARGSLSAAKPANAAPALPKREPAKPEPPAHASPALATREPSAQPSANLPPATASSAEHEPPAHASALPEAKATPEVTVAPSTDHESRHAREHAREHAHHRSAEPGPSATKPDPMETHPSEIIDPFER